MKKQYFNEAMQTGLESTQESLLLLEMIAILSTLILSALYVYHNFNIGFLIMLFFAVRGLVPILIQKFKEFRILFFENLKTMKERRKGTKLE